MQKTIKTKLDFDTGTLAIMDFKTKSLDGFTVNSTRQFIDLPMGDYKVKIKVTAWINSNQTYDFKVTSGRIYFGDACYLVNESSWATFLERTKMCEQRDEDCFFVNLGGDGTFPIEITFEKI